jgi:pSer/pThr/pTyr-binding forkhead associated (FHA) protein/ribosomal protein L40E
MKVKICKSCGAENSPIDIECNNCMGDISGVRPTEKLEVQEPEPEPENNIVENLPVTIRETSASLVFSLISTSQSEVTLTLNNGDTLGREHVGKELFTAYNTVSRRHARIIRSDGGWAIEDAGSTNGTYVNGKKLAPGSKHPLKSKDIVALSRSCEFLVEIGR